MTPEEIRKLAVDYAEDATKAMAGDPNLPVSDLNGIKRDVAEYAEEVIRFILRTHCIVSKEKATELCRLTLEHGSSIDYGLIDGLTDIVCDIFREQYHAEAEKTDFNPDTFDETDK